MALPSRGAALDSLGPTCDIARIAKEHCVGMWGAEIRDGHGCDRKSILKDLRDVFQSFSSCLDK